MKASIRMVADRGGFLGCSALPVLTRTPRLELPLHIGDRVGVVGLPDTILLLVLVCPGDIWWSKRFGNWKETDKLMPCRIGITTKPEAAQVYWQDRAIGFANWQILEVFRSKAAAKEYETAYALRHECEAQLDNRDAPNAVRDSGTIYDWWYVYHFDYETVKE